MKNTRFLFLFLLAIVLTGCFDDKRRGLFGTSQENESSKNNGFYLAIYTPDKYSIKLLNNSTVIIDTAWAESMWAYDKNGNPQAAGDYGQNFVIPIVEQDFDNFLFTFDLLDKSNQSFTNGIEQTRCVLNPSVLKDTMEVIVEEKNPDRNLGWTKPIVTDTIKFIRVK